MISIFLSFGLLGTFFSKKSFEKSEWKFGLWRKITYHAFDMNTWDSFLRIKLVVSVWTQLIYQFQKNSSTFSFLRRLGWLQTWFFQIFKRLFDYLDAWLDRNACAAKMLKSMFPFLGSKCVSRFVVGLSDLIWVFILASRIGNAQYKDQRSRKGKIWISKTHFIS